VLEDFMGEVNIPFHAAMALARKVSLHSVVSQAEHRSLVGHEEAVFYQGRPMWKEDESLVSLDDETLALLGYPDRYQRDANGNRIQLTLHVQPPVALVLAIAAANFPAVYGDKRVITVNQKSSIGVTVMKTDYRKPLAAPQPVEVLTDQKMITDAVVQDVIDEEIAEAILEDDAEDHDDGADTQDDAEDVAPAPAPRPPTTTARPPTTTAKPTPAPSGPNPAIKRTGITDMERDLLARLAAKQGSPERVAPVARVSARDDDDYSADRVGAGPTPRGTKIA
jgi:hypothetical protein